MSANPQDKNDVTEETFVAQEALYFRTAALSRGVLYYHALSFLLVPVLAQMLNAQIQQGVIFTVIIVFILVLHLAHLVAYFFARPLYSRWTYDIAVEAILISALCIYSGGYESGFK
ncbi:MAG: hypothetical protein OEW08_13855, partial [Gammaproteobacteria bacterium]|nr:hypothetical protein [Gammaproteobacteria bacterium]